MKVNYDIPWLKGNDPRLYRLAKEHLDILELKSSVISFEIKSTANIRKMQIPDSYHIHYNLKSIIDITDEQSPIYGHKHTAEVTFPGKYPVESPKLKMLTDTWHPNIKNSGPLKGRICTNSQNFGHGYTVQMLAIRIGEILQYKNYHALHTPPYPEDANVAQWIKQYAEPHGIVDIEKGIVVDNTSLTVAEENVEKVYILNTKTTKTPDIFPKEEKEKNDSLPLSSVDNEEKAEVSPDETQPTRKIKIKSRKKIVKASKISIKRKNKGD